MRESEQSRGAQSGRLYHATVRQIRRVPALDTKIRDLFFRRDLRRLNDVLSTTALAGHYWVIGSLLLGSVREGRILAQDRKDADFAVCSEDARLFYEAVPALESAGYKLTFQFRNNEGQITQHSFFRHDAQFDFFFFFPGPDAAQRRYFVYKEAPTGWMELEGVLPDQPLERFGFLGREWLKPEDHETFLTAIYLDWRTPKTNRSYVEEERTIVARRPWNNTTNYSCR